LLQRLERDKAKDYVLPKFGDFKITLVSGVFFAISEIVCTRLFYVLFLPWCKV